MKRARFTEEQIIGVLKEHEAGAKTADLARKHGVSEATLYNWKAKYGGMDVSEAKRLKQLEGRERQTEGAFGRADVGCSRALRASVKKMVGPVAKREGVDGGARKSAGVVGVVGHVRGDLRGRIEGGSPRDGPTENRFGCGGRRGVSGNMPPR